MSLPPLVSIVLPTHNGSKYLEGSVRSCLAQDFGDFELIVVDDGSTDETPAIIERLAGLDSRIRPVRNERNRKLPGSLNVGFARSTGSYLTWTSDDNLYRPEAIGAMVAALESAPEVGLVYAGYTQIDDAGRPTGRVEAPPPGELGERSVVGACFLYRREVHERLGGYDEGRFLAEDYEYWLRVACAFPIRPIPRDLYEYRVHDASLTSRRLSEQQHAADSALEFHLPRMTWLAGRGRAAAHLRVADHAAGRGDLPAVRRHLRAAALAAPGYFAARVRPGMALKSLLGPGLYAPFRGLYRKFVRTDA